MKIALVDIETTGLDSTLHEIIEIGCIIFDHATFQVYGQMNFKVRPEHLQDAHPKALEINGYNKKEWKDAISLSEALMFFAKATEGCTFMAHNAMFDWSFIDFNLQKQKIPHSINKHKIDTVSIAWAKIPHDKVSSWSLKTLCSYFGIPPEPKIHRAINGAECAYQVYKKLMTI